MSRQLRIAFLVSFIWHVFLICSVSIVFMPNLFTLNQHASVVFLGSFLHDVVIAGKAQDSAKVFIELPIESKINTKTNLDAKPSVGLSVEKETFSPERFVDVDSDTEKQVFAVSFGEHRDAPLGPELIFQPSFVHYPEWEQQQWGVGTVVFRIYISAEGLVEEVINTQASGNPEIDAALARYIRRWRFVPVAEAPGQWQRVEMKLDFDQSQPLTIKFTQG